MIFFNQQLLMTLDSELDKYQIPNIAFTIICYAFGQKEPTDANCEFK